MKDSTLDQVDQRISVAQHAPAVNGAVAVEDDEEWINPALARANSAAPTTTTARRTAAPSSALRAIVPRAASVASVKPFEAEQTSGPID